MTRKIAIDILGEILDDIHNEKPMDIVEKKCKELQRNIVFSDMQLDRSEIRADRTREYIKFFNITGVSEEDMFKNKKDFYELAAENLIEEWEDIEQYLATTGRSLDEYPI